MLHKYIYEFIHISLRRGHPYICFIVHSFMPRVVVVDINLYVICLYDGGVRMKSCTKYTKCLFDVLCKLINMGLWQQ